jgi:hypothetical protein
MRALPATTFSLARLTILGNLSGGDMLDTERAAHLTDKLLEVIAPELNREPRTPDNVWCVIEAVACVVAGLIKEPVARRYYGRALDHYSRDLASRAG